MSEADIIDNNCPKATRDNHDNLAPADPQYSIGRSLVNNLDAHVVNRSFCLQQSDEEEDEQKVYKMEIQQLKRQNKFLKKKIEQLNKKPENQFQTSKKTSKKKPVKPRAVQTKQNRLSELQFSIDYFFEQIRKTVESCCQVFRIKLREQSLQEQKTEASNPSSATQYKQNTKLQKNLQRVILQSEEKRYGLLLQNFTDFYQTTKQNQNYLKSKVQVLSQEIIQISKKVLKAANQKHMKASSCSFISMSNSRIDERQMTIEADNVCFADHAFDVNKGKVSMTKDRTLLNIF